MSNILEIEKDYTISCNSNENDLFNLTINNIVEEIELISLKLEKIDIINLINSILKVYSASLNRTESICIETDIINNFDLGYSIENEHLIFYIKEARTTLKLTAKDLLKLSIMLSSKLI